MVTCVEPRRRPDRTPAGLWPPREKNVRPHLHLVRKPLFAGGAGRRQAAANGALAVLLVFHKAVSRRLSAAHDHRCRGGDHRRDAADFRRPDRRPARQHQARRFLRRAWAAARPDGLRRAFASAVDGRRCADPQPCHRAEPHRPHPLAEPLACRAPGLVVLPERLCRPHRDQGHAERRFGGDERQSHRRCRLVCAGVRRGRHRGAGPARPASAGGRGGLAGVLLPDLLVRDAQDHTTLVPIVGAVVAGERPHGRQLHQYPDAQDILDRQA